MKKAIQLYSIRKACEENLSVALKAMAEQGYAAVEFANFYNYTADQINEMLKRYGLEIVGSHIDQNDIFDNLNSTIAYQKAIGNKRIVCPWSDLKTKEDVVAFAEKVKIAAPKYKEAGMQLYYHNHSHEFKKDGEKYLIDILHDLTTADELWFELDMYWVFCGGADPLYYLEKYKDRMDVFHAKDGTSSISAPVGDGVLPYDEILNTARKLNMQYAIVECESENNQKSELYDTKISANFLEKNEKKSQTTRNE